MELPFCKICGGRHRLGSCPDLDPLMPIAEKRATLQPVVNPGAVAEPQGRTAIPPTGATKKKPGRPRTGFDKKAYQRELMRKRRAAE